MAGNSPRRGATRKPGTKKGAAVGSGGQRRQGLQGKGPTPKATERAGHPAARASARRQQPNPGRGPRRDTGPELVSGRNPVVEALRAGVPARVLYVVAPVDSDDRVKESLKRAAALSMPILEVTRGDLDRMTGGAVHQGLAIQVPAYEYSHPDDLLAAAAESGEPALLVALDGVTDPRNLGAVVRSTAAFGGQGVIVPTRRAAGMTAAAWKVSAGAAARLPVARAGNLTRALDGAKAAGCLVVGLDAGGDVALADVDAADTAIVLVVGAEGRGLSRLVRATCDVVASIPMAAGAESLNAGVAAGIALYEVARQRAHR